MQRRNFLKMSGLGAGAVVSGGSLAGFAPFMARQIAIDYLKLDKDLLNLRALGLFKVSVLFAIISPLVHQLWYFWTGRTENFLTSTAVMMVGDWFGTVLVLASLGLLLRWLKSAVAKVKANTTK